MPSERPRALSDTAFAAHLEVSGDAPAPGRVHDLLHYAGHTFDDVRAPNASFVECAFTGVTFEGGSLRRARLRDVWVGDTRLVATDVAESSWAEVTVDASMLAGVQIFGAEWRRVAVRGCKVTGVNLRGVTMSHGQVVDLAPLLADAIGIVVD